MIQRPGSQRPRSSRRSLPERRAGERRVLWVGLLVSGVIHLILLALAGGWLEPDPSRASRPSEPLVAEPPRGMRAIRLASPPEQAVPTEPQEPERPEPEPEPEPPPARVAQTDPTPAEPADSLSAADRLAPRVVDPRLWRPMVILPMEPTIDEVEARVGAALELLSDSMLAEAEAALRARDWTVEDESGGRWGISPQGLHLGDLTLPLPIWMPVNVDADLEEQRWLGLERDLDRARILESFEERVKAIRARRDRERAERGNGGSEGG